MLRNSKGENVKNILHITNVIRPENTLNTITASLK